MYKAKRNSEKMMMKNKMNLKIQNQKQKKNEKKRS
jgi:hypothetical protein